MVMPFRCSVVVFEDVVLVVQCGETFGQRQLVPEALVPEGQLAWCQLAGQHPGGVPPGPHASTGEPLPTCNADLPSRTEGA
ncbi:hypothetical protein B7755_041100 [Streptomyces sp. NBS 14/10]|uniref:hypothetical protein n=1 Tax=Streptomyces sp. NBS 14/10 TaxID=1945643 RepID=UPI000B7FD926|nr:hypothetical protein [Streptomyces sp. NBS 14/10]KAK1183950.1 hypothetical protein B7755_041100 [Streptomyces sp. NBS 14/10]